MPPNSKPSEPLLYHSFPSKFTVAIQSARSVLFDGAVHSTESELLQCKDGKLYTPHRCNSSALMTVMVKNEGEYLKLCVTCTYCVF